MSDSNAKVITLEQYLQSAAKSFIKLISTKSSYFRCLQGRTLFRATRQAWHNKQNIKKGKKYKVTVCKIRRGKGSIFSVFVCTTKETMKVHTTDDLQSDNPQRQVLIFRLADESSIRVTWNLIPLLHRPKRRESHLYLQKTLPNIWCNWQDQRNGKETWHDLAERHANTSKHISSDDNRLTNFYFQLTFKNTNFNCSKTQFLPQSKEPVPRSNPPMLLCEY